MPFRYSHADPTVRQRILARIAGGEFLKRICREDGMPCQESVNGWMRRDPTFAGQVAEARVRGDWLRRFACHEGPARAVLVGLGAGRKLNDILREPGMPSYHTYMYWRRTNMWFAEEAGRIIAARMAERSRKIRGRYRYYDAEVGDRIYVRLWKGERLRDILRSDKAFPSLTVLERWRREQPVFDATLKVAINGWKARRRGAGARLMTPELTHKIKELIREGHSLRSLSRRRGMPCQGTLYAWVRRDPVFAAKVAQACEEREATLIIRQAAAMASQSGKGEKAIAAAAAPIARQRWRLRKRPGWKAARAAS